MRSDCCLLQAEDYCCEFLIIVSFDAVNSPVEECRICSCFIFNHGNMFCDAADFYTDSIAVLKTGG